MLAALCSYRYEFSSKAFECYQPLPKAFQNLNFDSNIEIPCWLESQIHLVDQWPVAIEKLAFPIFRKQKLHNFAILSLNPTGNSFYSIFDNRRPGECVKLMCINGTKSNANVPEVPNG